MSVKIIAGRADTGKSSLIYDEIIRESKKSNSNLILIVPELMTYQTECNIIEGFDLDGIMNIEILSFKRLENKILEEVGGLKVQDISIFGKIMLLRQVFEENKDKLQVFGNSYKQSGFLKEFEELLSEFKQNLIDPPSLKKAAENVEDELLIRKLSDIELIYSKFIEKTSGRYFDEGDKTNLCISFIGESSYIRNSKIWIDGFESFNRQRINFIKNLIDYSKAVTITLNADSSYLANLEEKDDWEAFKVIYDTYNILKRTIDNLDMVPLRGNKSNSPEIKAIEKNMFSLNMEEFQEDTDKINIYSSLNPFTETQRAAANIVSLVRDKGYRWKDIKVAVGNMDTYEIDIKRVFTQYEIPFFLDVKRDIMNNPLTKYILSILDMFIWKFKHDNVFEYLKTGFSPLNKRQVDCLENYALQYGIEGGKWFKEFKSQDDSSCNEETDNPMEEYRQLFASDFEKERREIHNLKTAKDITKFIFKYFRKHNIQERIENAVKKFNSLNKFEEASEFSQCWNFVMDIFQQLLLVGGDEEISLTDYRKMLEAGLNQVEISIIPPTIDKVEVGPIDRIAVTKSKVLYILGGNDSNLDAQNTEKYILLNDERDILLENSLELTKAADYDLFKEKHMLYKLFSSPRERLYISYPLGTSTGESMQPSMYIDNLKYIFPKVKEVSEISGEDELNFVSNYKGTYDYLVENMRNFIDGYEIDDIWKDVYAWYEKEDKENFQIINKALSYSNSTPPLKSAMVKRIYQNNLTMTVSKLESYGECQFKYFVENVLKPRERIVQKIEFYDLGNIYHSVVEKFINNIKESDLSSIDRMEAEIKAVEITEEILKEWADKVTAIEANHRNKYMKEKIKRVMKRTCWTIVKQLQGSEFRPKYTELQIDLVDRNDEKTKEGIYLSPIEIPVVTDSIKEVLKLRGVIDRVDVFENEDKLYINIIDYKSSPTDINLDDVSEGLQIQLLVYLKVLVEKGQELFGKKPNIGGIFYYYFNDPIYKDENKNKDIEEEIFKGLKLKGYVLKDEEIVRFMDKNITDTSSVIPAAFKKNGEFYESRTKALTEEGFENLMDLVYEKCVEMTKSILEGNISINPYKKLNGMTPCKYCQYISICQFDRTLGNKYHLISKRDLNIAGKGVENNVD